MSEGPLAGVQWVGELDQGRLLLLDQTRLPGAVELIDATELETLRTAIIDLAVRGAPAIGIAAAYGLAAHCWQAAAELAPATAGYDLETARAHADDRLRSSRPTAVNLFHCLDRMRTCFESHEDLLTARELAARLLLEAKRIHAEDARLCESISKHGAELLPEGGCVLTICNTGALATGGVGTALGCLRAAHEGGRNISVVALETRPLLQGARLTALECMRAGIPVRLATDGMAGHLMQRGQIQAVIVGADRITARGDTANKIGTYQLAVLAQHHGIPFYVAAPSTTFDLSISAGSDIPIEERAAEEVRTPRGASFAPADVPVHNPAFDVTPAELISAIITEIGVIDPVGEDEVRGKVAGAATPPTI